MTYVTFTDFIMYAGSDDNKYRVRNGLSDHDWTKELAKGKSRLGMKCRSARSYEFGQNKRVGLYFTCIPDVPLNFVVYLDADLNKDSSFYKLVASMDRGSVVNARIAKLLFVSDGYKWVKKCTVGSIHK